MPRAVATTIDYASVYTTTYLLIKNTTHSLSVIYLLNLVSLHGNEIA